jgi:hypothetical protein
MTDDDAPALIAAGLDAMWGRRGVHEIRILGTRESTVSGYFDNQEDATNAIAAYDRRDDVPAIYSTLNRTNPALLARAENRLKPYAKAATTSKDIIRRDFLLADCDPIRPTNISSTDAEHEAGIARAQTINAFLIRDLGFPDSMLGDSGNGGHVQLTVDLPNDGDSLALAKNCLAALDLLFSDETVKVDTSVADANRICKMYGTMTRKGDDTEERPHRRSRIIFRPNTTVIVTREQLQRLADLVPKEESRSSSRSSSRSTNRILDVPAALDKWELVVKFSAPFADGQKWVLETCPFDQNHTNGSALIIQFKSGATSFGCRHDSCQTYKWQHLRERFESGYRYNGNGNSSYFNREGANDSEQTEVIDWEDAQPWPRLSLTALHGLAGDFVRMVSPHSEADPAGLLLQFLCEFGCAIGRSPHFMVEATRHPARIFTIIVGATSGGRKGTARDQVSRVFRVADLEWHDSAQISGLASGEGLIERLKDREDDAVEKRVLVSEPEFARLLTAASRDGSTLGAVIRDAWESDRLQNLTRQRPLIATNTHVGIIGHITQDELRAKLSSTDIANGFFNRFIPICVKRSKRLPYGGSLAKSDIDRVGKRLRELLDFARSVNEVKRTASANVRWQKFYMAVPEPEGLLGAVTARAEAQVLRLSLIFALLDGKRMIDAPHLEAAEALWAYAHASAQYIFGSALGDHVADRVLEELRATYPNGCEREHLYRLFSGHMNATRLRTAIEYLVRRKLACTETIKTQGRSCEIAYAVRREKSDLSERSNPDPDPNSPNSPNSRLVDAQDARLPNDEAGELDLSIPALDLVDARLPGDVSLKVWANRSAGSESVSAELDHQESLQTDGGMQGNVAGMNGSASVVRETPVWLLGLCKICSRIHGDNEDVALCVKPPF